MNLSSLATWSDRSRIDDAGRNQGTRMTGLGLRRKLLAMTPEQLAQLRPPSNHVVVPGPTLDDVKQLVRDHTVFSESMTSPYEFAKLNADNPHCRKAITAVCVPDGYKPGAQHFATVEPRIWRR